MAKATYYFEDGRGQLQSVPCDADDKGNLTKPGEKTPFCTEAQPSDEPKSGFYTLEAKAEAKAPAKDPAK